MAGFIPAIHVFLHGAAVKTWMPATSAGMTENGSSSFQLNRAGNCSSRLRNLRRDIALPPQQLKELTMSFGKGALLWLIGIPLPIILLLALFWR
jgi:hypothetical protein